MAQALWYYDAQVTIYLVLYIQGKEVMTHIENAQEFSTCWNTTIQGFPGTSSRRGHLSWDMKDGEELSRKEK